MNIATSSALLAFLTLIAVVLSRYIIERRMRKWAEALLARQKELFALQEQSWEILDRNGYDMHSTEYRTLERKMQEVRRALNTLRFKLYRNA